MSDQYAATVSAERLAEIKARLRDCGDMVERYKIAWLLLALAREQAERIRELEKAIKVQANATRNLHQLGIERTRHLEKRDRSEYFAAKTLDSEREANAILTARVEELEAENERLRNDPAVKAFNPHDGGNRD